MLDGTDISLLYEWMEYYNLEPFGEHRADIRNAIACVATFNAFGAKKAGGGAVSISDFMPEFGKPEKKPQSQTEIQNILQRLYGNHSKPGGKPDSKDRQL